MKSNQTSDLSPAKNYRIAKLERNGNKMFASVKGNSSPKLSFLLSAQSRSHARQVLFGIKTLAHAPSSNSSTAPTPVQKVKFSIPSHVSVGQLRDYLDRYSN